MWLGVKREDLVKPVKKDAASSFSVVTVKLGGFWIDWHMRSGYAVLTLVLFRLLWGFAGSRYALFSQFVRGPGDVLRYLTGRLSHGAGHNPLGALSVLALLALLLAQATGGLFVNDGSFTEGPLAKLTTSAISDRISTLHRLAEWPLYVLVGVHVCAVIYYSVFKFQPLLGAMVHGDRELPCPPRRTICRCACARCCCSRCARRWCGGW
jgi:cytochrome b